MPTALPSYHDSFTENNWFENRHLHMLVYNSGYCCSSFAQYLEKSTLLYGQWLGESWLPVCRARVETLSPPPEFVHVVFDAATSSPP